MAGTVTVSEVRHTPLKKVTFTWTSSAAGAADGVSAGVYAGEIVRVVQIPDAGGTQPTNAYDLTVLDDDGADLLNGLGANLSNAATTIKAASDGLGALVSSKLTLAVTNAGNAKAGKTIVYIR